MTSRPQRRPRVGLITFGAGAVAASLLGTAAAFAGGKDGGQVQIPTTVEDFFQPGTQPDPTGLDITPILPAWNCEPCHGDYLPNGLHQEPFNAWKNTMMAQAGRDPIWHAALAIANQDAEFAGEYCIRCHAPGAWLGGRSLPPDTSGVIELRG